MDASVGYEMLSNLHPDHQEAVNAFNEKRRPRFANR
jgi:enoyl-CoA hydratase/carnithine racemase